ncbi:MAG: diguanylate cyclase domain-containing protein [Culicoidibacterales bacterium]
MGNNVIANILEKQENGIIILNTNKEIVYVNERVRNLIGNDTNKVLGNYLNCRIAKRERVNCQKTTKCDTCEMNTVLSAVMISHQEQTLHDVTVNKNNLRITVSIKISFVKGYLLLELYGFIIKNFEADLLSRIADESKDFLFFKDKNLNYIYLNQTFANFFQKDKEDLVGKSDKDLMEAGLMPEELYEQCLQGDQICLEKGFYHEIEVMGDQHFRVSKEFINNGIVSNVRDITDEVKAIKKAEIDELTGTNSRHKFADCIDNIYKHQYETYYMALIDLDDLRGLNNKYGHLKGDVYLKAIGQVLNKQTEATFFRVGGDEFIGLIDETKASPEEIFKQINDELQALNFVPKLTISVGIEYFNLNNSYEENYEIADKLLYVAKKTGKNKVLMNYKEVK